MGEWLEYGIKNTRDLVIFMLQNLLLLKHINNHLFIPIIQSKPGIYLPLSLLILNKLQSLDVALPLGMLNLHKLAYFLNAPSRPPVEASCPLPAPGSSISLRIFLANTLPSSTPHWSNELMSQMAPSVKVRCS